MNENAKTGSEMLAKMRAEEYEERAKQIIASFVAKWSGRTVEDDLLRADAIAMIIAFRWNVPDLHQWSEASRATKRNKTTVAPEDSLPSTPTKPSE